MRLFFVLTLFGLSLSPSLKAQEFDFTSWAFGDLYGDDELSFPYLGLNRGPELSFRARTAASLAQHAKARAQIVIHKSMKERGYQFLTLTVDGKLIHVAPVSTAWERLAPAKVGGAYRAWTPAGKFFPDSFEDKRFSKKWQVWLKYVIRFNSGIWIHATTPDHFEELGAPASGGCTRVHPVDAKFIYQTVKPLGANEVAITVLPEDADEAQVPWTYLKRAKPSELLQWKASLTGR